MHRTKAVFRFIVAWLCCVALNVARADTVVVTGRGVAAVGGPDVWYDATPFAGTDGTFGGNTNRICWQSVTVGAAGTATKLRLKCGAYYGGSEVVKMALYDGTTLLSDGTVSVNGTGNFEVTLAAAQAVTAKAYNVGIAWVGGSIDMAILTSGTFSINTSNTYTGFPQSPLPAASSTPAGTLAVGIYVD